MPKNLIKIYIISKLIKAMENSLSKYINEATLFEHEQTFESNLIFEAKTKFISTIFNNKSSLINRMSLMDLGFIK